jgi:hypothetical protein
MLLQIIRFFLMPIVWIPIVLLLAFATYKNYKKANKLQVLNFDAALLLIEPSKTAKDSAAAMERLFASLHNILRSNEELKNSGGVQEHLGFEMTSSGGKIRFFVWTPKVLQKFVESQLYAENPDIKIYRVKTDYADFRNAFPISCSSELTLSEPSALPIKTYTDLNFDSISPTLNALSRLNPNVKEELWLQLLIRPISDADQKADTSDYAKRLGSGKKSFTSGHIDFKYLLEILSALWKPPTGGSGGSATISDADKAKIKKAEEKAQKPAFETKIRLVYLGQDETDAKIHIGSLQKSLGHLSDPTANSFKSSSINFSRVPLDAYKLRQFSGDSSILNTAELASVFHLPDKSLSEISSISWINESAAITEIPAKLPVLTGDSSYDRQISAFGLVESRSSKQQFGLLRADRPRGLYISGQTETGKSSLLSLLAISDIYQKYGLCLFDPSGSTAANLIPLIPASRINDVIFLNLSDTSFPFAFNPLETDEQSRPNLLQSYLSVFKKHLGQDYSNDTELLLRNLLSALTYRKNATLLDIPKFLTDSSFRNETLRHCTDMLTIDFWWKDFINWDTNRLSRVVSPLNNRLNSFFLNPVIRNIIGQPNTLFDFREVVERQKILIVSLDREVAGTENTALLGSLLLAKLENAALSKTNENHPFYLYMDNFTTFATDSFRERFSDFARHNLCLTLTDRHPAQLSTPLRSSILNNFGTCLSFRSSTDDAEALRGVFGEKLVSSLPSLKNRHFAISMLANHEKLPPFNATTLTLPSTPDNDTYAEIIRQNRPRYARPIAEVELKLIENN